MDLMDFNELFNLLQNSDETDRIEVKSAAQGIGKSFLETVSAFSNEPDLGGSYIRSQDMRPIIGQNILLPAFVIQTSFSKMSLPNVENYLAFSSDLRLKRSPIPLELFFWFILARQLLMRSLFLSKNMEWMLKLIDASAHWIFRPAVYSRRFRFALSASLKKEI